MRIAASEGVDGLTIQRLAAAMDWSAGALYRYYRGKDALLVAMQERVLGRLGDRLLRARAAFSAGGPAHPDPRVGALCSVLALCDAFRAFALEDFAGFSLVTVFVADQRALLNEEEALQVGRAMAAVLETTSETLEDAVAQGALAPGDARDRTLVLWSALQGLLQLGKLERLEPRLSRSSNVLVRTLTDGLLLGWGADSENLTAAHGVCG
jgi:AcrR family transcriptional regulator